MLASNIISTRFEYCLEHPSAVVEKLTWADFVASAAAREKRGWEESHQQDRNIEKITKIE
jgi:hypothetical protein